MDNVINSIKGLFQNYGFRAASVIVATVVAVNVLKKPIVRRAEALAAKNGSDKSIVTKYVTLLPVAVAFLIEVAVRLVEVGFDFAAVSYAEAASQAVLYGALAVATYESVKKQLEAYAAGKYAGLGLGSNTRLNGSVGKSESSKEVDVVGSGAALKEVDAVGDGGTLKEVDAVGSGAALKEVDAVGSGAACVGAAFSEAEAAEDACRGDVAFSANDRWNNCGWVG